MSKTKNNIESISNDLYKLEIIAEEITNFTKAPELEVWKKLCLELEQTGYNVSLRAKEYNVNPHVFDEKMINLYQFSDGFIYETLIESRNPFRVGKWIKIVDFLLLVTGDDFSERKVLLYGDSVGSDSIFLKKLGFDVFYYDYDSYCSKFAHYRFSKRGLQIKSFTDKSSQFDFVICLEVAEHVPEPKELIEELKNLTKEDGYCIFSEAFGLITPNFPTHLASNLVYVGKTDELFKEVGMYVSWRDEHDKPIVYTKKKSNVFYVPKKRKMIARKVKNLIRRIVNS